MTTPDSGESLSSSAQRSPQPPPKTMTDLLALPDRDRKLMNWLVRQRRASLADIARHAQAEGAAILPVVDALLAAGFLVIEPDSDPAVFKPNLVSRRPRAVPDALWTTLE